MKKLFTLLLTLAVTICAVFSLTGCSEKGISGTFEHKKGDTTVVVYLYEDCTGYMVSFEDGEIDSDYYFEYKILEDNKYVAIKESAFGCDVYEYEFTDNGKTLMLFDMLFKKR